MTCVLDENVLALSDTILNYNPLPCLPYADQAMLAKWGFRPCPKWMRTKFGRPQFLTDGPLCLAL